MKVVIARQKRCREHNKSAPHVLVMFDAMEQTMTVEPNSKGCGCVGWIVETENPMVSVLLTIADAEEVFAESLLPEHGVVTFYLEEMSKMERDWEVRAAIARGHRCLVITNRCSIS